MSSDAVREMFRQRFLTFAELRREAGEEGALEVMLEREVERERRQMGPFIAEGTLAEGFARAIPVFESLGMRMRVVDLSSEDRDGVLEVQGSCPYASHAAEVGVERPCTAACELDLRAVCVAFPEMTGRVLATLADGDCACLFKYERPRRRGAGQGEG